jgi:phage terminase large subunit
MQSLKMNREELIKHIQKQQLIKEINLRKYVENIYTNEKITDYSLKLYPDKINNVYQHIMKTKARVIINYGGRDSGKSFFTGGQYIPFALHYEKYFRGIALRKTYVSNRDSTFAEIKDGVNILGINDKITALANPLEVRHINGNKIIFRGMDDTTNIKSLKGINFFWFEEAEVLTETEFDDLLILLRGNGYQRAILTFNPVDEEHFTNQRFVLCKKDRILETFDDGEPKVWEIDIREKINGELVQYTVLVVRSTFDDNKFIPPVRKLIIEKLKETNPFLYDVYRKGKFGTRGGRILTNWQEVDLENQQYKFENFDNRGYVQDFGFNHANVILSLIEKDNNLYIFDEIYVTEKDTDEIIRIANEKNYDKDLRMICDSAEPDRIKTWQKAGYNAIPVKKYQGSVITQIDKLKRYNCIYIDSKCTNTLKEIKQWYWKQDKFGKYTDEPVNVFDDAMAALRYSSDLFDGVGFWIL